LLGVSDAALALQQMAPDIRRRRTHDALTRLWVRESAERPLVVIVEDLHWLAPGSERFLAAFAPPVPGAGVLLLTNGRPEDRETWSAVRVRLAPLRPPAARTLVVELLGEHP